VVRVDGELSTGTRRGVPGQRFTGLRGPGPAFRLTSLLLSPDVGRQRHGRSLLGA